MSVAIQLPGSSGHYLSTSDTNILDADTAHLEQSAGLWTAGALSTDFYTFGTKSLKVSSGASTAITPATDAAYMGVYVYSVAGDTFDINGDTGVAVPAATWTEVTPDTGTAGTYTVNAAGSADYYIGKAWLSATDTGWVPSIRIVGDLDMRAKLAADDWTPSAISCIMGSADLPNGGFDLRLNTNGSIRADYPDGSGNRGASGFAPSPAFVDGEPHEFRVTYDVSTGGLDFYYDGALNRSTTVTVAAGGITDNNLYVGSLVGVQLLAGDFYWCEVRDGIDGPIVARFDAADWIGTT